MDPWLSTTEKRNKVDFAVICPSRRHPPFFKTFELGVRLYFNQLFYCSFNTPQVLEWAVLAPVSADVVLTLLPYTDSTAKESTLRLFLVLKGRYFLEHGMYDYIYIIWYYIENYCEHAWYWYVFFFFFTGMTQIDLLIVRKWVTMVWNDGAVDLCHLCFFFKQPHHSEGGVNVLRSWWWWVVL